jgi:phosphate starvation-inducible protein PhoH
MPRRRKSNSDVSPVNFNGDTYKRRKKLGSEFLLDIGPITDNQKKLFESYDEGKNLVAHGVPGTGKAQPLYSKILTPAGWTTMGEIQIGDEVIIPGNHTSKVIGIFPQKKKAIYEITLEGGLKTRACLEHLWKISIPCECSKYSKSRIVDTQFMINYLQENSQCKHSILIPVVDPETGEKTNYPLIDIQYVGDEEAQCIMIDDDNHLYITDDYIVTHNTFCVLYKALQDVMNELTPYEKIYIVRSLVQTRDIGFMPGDHENKAELFEIPYKNMVKYMFKLPSESDFDMLYSNLKSQDTISFWSTSFTRGTTLDNSIIIVDEMQNLNGHELSTMITRVGENSKIMFSGDVEQSDLVRLNERNGIYDFLRILQIMPSFDIIEFDIDDIVRSALVKEYIIAKRELKINFR